MTQYWVSQVVTSLGFVTVWDRKFQIKNFCNSKNLCEYCCFFVFDFLCQTVPIPPDQNMLIPLDQNVSILLVSNLYNENIGTFWYRKLCRKPWYSLESLLIFVYVFLDPNCPNTPNIHTTLVV